MIPYDEKKKKKGFMTKGSKIVHLIFGLITYAYEVEVRV